MAATIRAILITIILAHISSAVADAHAPFTIANYNPVPSLLGLPSMPDLSQFEAPAERKGDGLAWAVYADFINFFAATLNSREIAVIDGESYRYSALLSVALTENALLQFKLPYNNYFGGGMDSSIESWHKTFNLPGGGRGEYPRDRLRFLYVRDNRLLFDYQKDAKGPLDASMRYLYRLPAKQNNLTQAIFVQTEFANGEQAQWRGNGHIDVSAGYAATRRLSRWARSNRFYYDLAVLFPGRFEPLHSQQNPLVAVAASGFSMTVFPRLQLKAQLDVNSKIIRDTRAQELGGEAAQLTLGGDLLFHNFRLEIGVAEDLIIDASPDVIFHIGVASR